MRTPEVPTIHLTVKFNVPASLLKDRDAFVAEALRAAYQTTLEAADGVFRMETTPEPVEALAVPPEVLVSVFKDTPWDPRSRGVPPPSPPSKQWSAGDGDTSLSCS